MLSEHEIESKLVAVHTTASWEVYISYKIVDVLFVLFRVADLAVFNFCAVQEASRSLKGAPG